MSGPWGTIGFSPFRHAGEAQAYASYTIFAFIVTKLPYSAHFCALITETQIGHWRYHPQRQVYKDPAALETHKRALGSGRLTYLNTNCPLEKLTPLEGPVCALPSSLHGLKVHLPLEGGILPDLEHLTNLRGLSIINTGDAPMHLDRLLDPFLEMAHLTALVLCGNPEKLRASMAGRQVP